MNNGTTSDFIKIFHGDNKVNFRVINTTNPKDIKIFNINGTYEEYKDQLRFYNDMNFEVYFTVNSGGTKQAEINKVNAVFIDLDCGKDSSKQYFPIGKVESYKREQLNKINQFEFKPSAIIETRNGYHVYWVTNTEVNIDKFQSYQDELIKYFDSDVRVNTLERIMRLPNYYWNKDTNNKFKVKLVELNNNQYDVNELIKKVTELNNNNITNNQTNTNDNVDVRGKGVKDRISINNSSLPLTLNSRTRRRDLCVPLIEEGEIGALQEILKPEYRLMENEGEFYDYITQEIDLSELLGVPMGRSFKCLFHNDSSPSASIFISNRGQYFYKCHSASCGFRGNIIRCIERLRGCKRPQAINFIKEVFKLEIKDTDWQREQKQILMTNKKMLLSGEFEDTYPEVYKIVKKYIGVINVLHDIAIEHVYDEQFTDDNNNVVFFASMQKICQALELAKVNQRISKQIGLLAFMYLVNKLNKAQIPEVLEKKATNIAATHKHKNIVSFYSIPSYSDNQMVKSMERAILYAENNMTMKAWGKELLERTFGKEVADEVYPYMKGDKPHEKKPTIKTEHIHKITNDLIEEKGFATEKEITYCLQGLYSELNQPYNKQVIARQVKISLQEMLNAYDWKRIRLNKKIKEQQGIECEGYPFVIVPN